VKQFFGGKVESAKTDERKEFKTMLEFIKKDESISAISVILFFKNRSLI
jgi:DNA invertase Pin-like site-specific DNA recombinase